MSHAISQQEIDIADKPGPETVLIYRLGSLGDTIVALPCFHAIERAFPNHRRVVLTNSPVMSKAAALEVILKASGLIHASIPYKEGMRSIAEFWQLRQAIRTSGADTLIYMTAPRGLNVLQRDLLFFRLCGLKQVLCAPATPDTQECRLLDDGQLETETERLARCFAPLGPIDLADRTLWDLRLTAGEHEAADAALAPLGGLPFLTINMGGKGADKQWGSDNWTALLRALQPRWGTFGMVTVGAVEERDASAAVLKAWPGPTLNLCGTLKPRETAAVLGRARAFVGHDSGPLHLAAVRETPTVGLFGGGNRPRQWHPYGDRHHPIHDMAGMSAITVARVHDALEALIDPR